MTTPRYEVDDVRHLFNDVEIAHDRDHCASLPFGVWDRIEARYVSRHPDYAAATAALSSLDTTTTVRS